MNPAEIERDVLILKAREAYQKSKARKDAPSVPRTELVFADGERRTGMRSVPGGRPARTTPTPDPRSSGGNLRTSNPVPAPRPAQSRPSPQMTTETGTKPSRSGTNRRQRQVQVGVRLLPDEWALLQQAAEREHVSPAVILRRAFLGYSVDTASDD